MGVPLFMKTPYHHPNIFPAFFTPCGLRHAWLPPRQRGGGAAPGEVSQGQKGRHRGKSPKDPTTYREHDHGKAGMGGGVEDFKVPLRD